MAHPFRILTLLALANLPLPAGTVVVAPADRSFHAGAASQRAGRGERVEVLVGQPPPEAREAAVRGAGDDEEAVPELAWENNGMAFAARVPWAEPAARRDQWLAAAHRSLFLVSGRGEVRPAPGPAPAGGPGEEAPAPDFTRVAVRPGTGGRKGEWEAFAWDARGRKVWRMDAKGRLAPYASLAQEIVYCYNLAADRAGTVYISGARVVPAPEGEYGYGTQIEGFYRIGRNRSVTLLAGGGTSFEVTDGTGPKARFAHQVTFALAEDRGCAYILDFSDDGSWVRALRLADGSVTSRPLDHPRFQDPFVQCWPAYHRGVLLASVTTPPAVFAVDPGSGHCEQVYGEAPADQPRSGGPAGAVSRRPVAGPRWREGVQEPGSQWGSMGFNASGLSVGADGRAAFVAGGHLGLLFLDWAAPRSPLSRGRARALRPDRSQPARQAGAARVLPATLTAGP